ncbi:MAG TPA: hypothetical protein PLV51_04395 [Lentimicrobium sp.]|nr:hypothetical protein [Lentimicrobium sp.]
MKHLPITLLVIVTMIMLHASLKAAGENRPAGARSAAMANASVALQDLWSAFNNQAGLTALTDPVAGIFAENRFLIKELGFRAGVMALPAKAGTLAVSFSHFGYSAYNEWETGLAFARKFGKNFSAGLQLSYGRVSMGENYGQRGYTAFEAGMQVSVIPELLLGVHVHNPGSPRFSVLPAGQIPAAFRMGLAWEVNPAITVTAETEKDISHKPGVRAGLEYRFNTLLHLRCGISTNPASNSFGIGIVKDLMIIDLSSSWHPVLGFSPQASFAIKF